VTDRFKGRPKSQWPLRWHGQLQFAEKQPLWLPREHMPLILQLSPRCACGPLGAFDGFAWGKRATNIGAFIEDSLAA
jgi:hypothetical protein